MKRTIRRHPGSRAVGIAVVASLLAGCGTDNEAINSLLLKSAIPSERSPADVGLTYENVLIPFDETQSMTGYFVPAQNGRPRGTVLMHTGMQGSVEDYIPAFPWWADHGLNILIYDWRGFGGSDGMRDFDHFEADARAAMEYLLSRPEPSAQAVIHFGMSLGAIPALAMTAEFPEESVGVIYIGGFVPGDVPLTWAVENVLPVLWPVAVVAGPVFSGSIPAWLDPRVHKDHVMDPILAITAVDDEFVPPKVQEELYNTMPDPKQRYLTFGGHTEPHLNDPNLGTVITEWSLSLEGLLPEPEE